MKILVLRHVPHEDLGSLQALLAERGQPFEYVDLFRGAQPPHSLEEVAGLIVLGGPMGAGDLRHPFLAEEVALLRQARRRHVPVLGICLGAQLLARACGARVYRNAVPEIGWARVEREPGADGDLLFGGFPERATVFQWHGDTFDLPEGATLLASSALCAHQAFRVDEKLWGVQFHLEITREDLAAWLAVPENCAELRRDAAERIRADTIRHADALTALARTIFTPFLDLCAGTLIDEPGPGEHHKPMSDLRDRRTRAPQFPPELVWLNTDRPLPLADLRGKIVLLDFWTFCCINCMHVLPDLKRLERRHGAYLVVIGVHSAKFENEAESEHIRQAIARYEIAHPVVNDARMQVWRSYGVRAWPTLALIDPEGYVVGALSGEGVHDQLDAAITRLAEQYRAAGGLDERPLKLRLERDRLFYPRLSFPGKVLADPGSGRLFIADSGHNRIVVADLGGSPRTGSVRGEREGRVRHVIGTGAVGRADGAFEAATFHHPQGMALVGEELYIADTENHLLRVADLAAGRVRTVAGTGEQGRERFPEGPGRVVGLNSPWDLVRVGRTLFIAMAGCHQIWRYDLDRGTVASHAGSGIEGRRDGPLSAAALAQPSGITTDGERLYVADSEVSCVRAVDIAEGGAVTTLAGGDLFEFGDADGAGDAVRLQHPLGIAWHEGAAYLADSYNHKIKRLEPASRRVRTLCGSGQSGFRDLPRTGSVRGEQPEFAEPGGIGVAAGRLYVADTNNHAIRVVDPATGAARTLALQGLPAAPAPASKPEAPEEGVRYDVGTRSVGRGAGPVPASRNGAGGAGGAGAESGPGPADGPIRVRAEVRLGPGHHVNFDAPNRYRMDVDERVVRLMGEPEGKLSADTWPMTWRLEPLADGGRSPFSLRLELYTCGDNDGLCTRTALVFTGELALAPPGDPASSELVLSATVG